MMTLVLPITFTESIPIDFNFEKQMPHGLWTDVVLEFTELIRTCVAKKALIFGSSLGLQLRHLSRYTHEIVALERCSFQREYSRHLLKDQLNCIVTNETLDELIEQELTFERIICPMLSLYNQSQDMDLILKKLIKLLPEFGILRIMSLRLGGQKKHWNWLRRLNNNNIIQKPCIQNDLGELITFPDGQTIFFEHNSKRIIEVLNDNNLSVWSRKLSTDLFAITGAVKITDEEDKTYDYSKVPLIGIGDRFKDSSE